MRVLFFCLIILFNSITISGQNNSKYDLNFDLSILYGKINFDAFESKYFSAWYQKEYKQYSLKNYYLKKLKKKKIADIRIKIAMASWCHDTQRELPRLIKILEKINFPMDQIQMYALDSKKECKDFDSSKHQINKVPTFIFYRDNKEIGRIIETPRRCLERDLVRIFSKR